MAIPLTYFPLSLTYQAFEAATFNTFLNPPEQENSIEDLSWIGRTAHKIGRTTREVIRFLALLIYGVSCTVFLAPFGLIYHTVASFGWKSKSWRAIDPKEKIVCSAIAWEHLKSAVMDGSGMQFANLMFFVAGDFPMLLNFASPDTMVDISSKRAAAIGLNSTRGMRTRQDNGWLGYNLQVHSQCPYSALVKGKERCWRSLASIFPLNNHLVIKHAAPAERPARLWYKKAPVSYEKIKISHLLAPGRPWSFSIPEDAIPLAILCCLLFFFSIGCGALAILAISPLALSLPAVFFFLPASLTFAKIAIEFFLNTRVFYIEERGRKDYEFAEKLTCDSLLTKEDSLKAGAWYFKSCQGHPEAQRRYGTLLLAKALKKIDLLDESSFEEERKYWLKKALEGFEWIAAAAENGNITARNLLGELFTSDVPDSLLRTPSTPLEKLQQLLLSHQFKQALVEFQDEFTKELSPGPNDVYIHLDTLVENHLQSQKDTIVKVVDETALFPAVLAKVIAEYAAFA